MLAFFVASDNSTDPPGDPRWLAATINRQAHRFTLAQLQSLRRAFAKLYAMRDTGPLSWYHQEFARLAIEALDLHIETRTRETDKPNII